MELLGEGVRYSEGRGAGSAQRSELEFAAASAHNTLRVVSVKSVGRRGLIESVSIGEDPLVSMMMTEEGDGGRVGSSGLGLGLNLRRGRSLSHRSHVGRGLALTVLLTYSVFI